MDSYHSWFEPTFYISIVLLYIFSLFKVSFEYIGSKEALSFEGILKKYVVSLRRKEEYTSMLLAEIIIIIIIASITGYFTFMMAISIKNIDGNHLLISTLSIVLTFIVVYFARNILPFITAFLRNKILYFSPIVIILGYIMSPFISLKYRLKAIGFNISSRSNISMEELSEAVEIVSKASTPEDKRILIGMVRFANADVSDVMCHRTDMVALNANFTYNEVLKIVKESGFSRIPVYQDVLDNIIGILYVKDLIPNIDVENFDWISFIRKPYFVSDSKMINEVLVKFQKKKIHLAIVVDKYGSTLGIVSLEDILEEIVGEIEDESDIEDPFYSKVDDNTYIFEGKTALSDFIQVLDISAESIELIKGQAETIAGLIVEFRQDIPKIGSKANLLDYCLTVVKVDKHRIERVKVTKTDKYATKE